MDLDLDLDLDRTRELETTLRSQVTPTRSTSSIVRSSVCLAYFYYIEITASVHPPYSGTETFSAEMGFQDI